MLISWFIEDDVRFRNLTEVAIEGEPLKVLLNRTHGADKNVHLFISKYQNDYDQNLSQRDPWSGWKCSPMSSMLETKEFLDWNCQLYYWTKILTRPIQLMPYSKHHLNVGRLFAEIRSKPFVVACAVKQAIEGLGHLNRYILIHVDLHSTKHICLKSVSEIMNVYFTMISIIRNLISHLSFLPRCWDTSFLSHSHSSCLYFYFKVSRWIFQCSLCITLSNCTTCFNVSIVLLGFSSKNG